MNRHTLASRLVGSLLIESSGSELPGHVKTKNMYEKEEEKNRTRRTRTRSVKKRTCMGKKRKKVNQNRKCDLQSPRQRRMDG